MKKLLLICIIIVGIVFIAGCIGGEKVTDSKSSTDSQTNQKSDVQIPDFILKSSDLPSGFVYYNSLKAAILKSDYCLIKDISDGSLQKKNGYSTKPYQYGDLGTDYRDYMGSIMYVLNDKGQIKKSVKVDYYIFDSSEGLKEHIEKIEKSNSPLTGLPNIGDYSTWVDEEYKSDTDLLISYVSFASKSNLVIVTVLDEKDKVHEEALRIAKIVKEDLIKTYFYAFFFKKIYAPHEKMPCFSETRSVTADNRWHVHHKTS